MIVDVLVTAFLGVLTAILSLIPEFDLWTPDYGGPTGTLADGGWFSRIGALMAIWDLFFPVGTVLLIVAAILAAKVFVVLVQLLRWVWDALPMKGT